MAAFDDPAVNAEVDRLYQLPLEEFVKARNNLAKRSRGSEASAIRALAKPNVLAWALNQLYGSQRRTFDRLVAAAASLRAAQAEALLGKPADLRAAADAHREAIREALQATARILQAASHPATPDAIRELTGALEALPWNDAGRLVRPPAASGFEALAGLPIAAQQPARRESIRADTLPHEAPPAPAKHEPARTRSKRQETRDSSAARHEHAAALKAARAAAAVARREEATAAKRLERAEKQLLAARQGEEAARQALEDAQRERAGAEEERRTAAAALAAARRASADAARRLED